MTFLVNPFWYPPNTPVVQGAAMSATATAALTLSPNQIQGTVLSAGAGSALALAGGATATAALLSEAELEALFSAMQAPTVWVMDATSSFTLVGAAIARAALDVDAIAALVPVGGAIARGAMDADVTAAATLRPIEAEAIAQLRFEVDVTTDDVGTYSWTNAGGTRDTGTVQFGAGALKLDPSGIGSVEDVYTAGLGFGSGLAEATVEAWVKQETTTQLTAVTFEGGTYASPTGKSFGFSIQPGSSIVTWVAYDPAGSNIFARNVGFSPDTAWHHWAATFDGSTYRLFRDGAVIDSFASSSLPCANTFAWVHQFANAAGAQTAYVDNARWCSEALYTASFTPGDF